MADETVVARLTIDSSGVVRGVNETGDALRTLGAHADEAGFHIGKLGARFFEAFLARDALWKAMDAGRDVMRDMIKDTEDYEQAQFKLSAVIKATGDASGVTFKQIKDLADEMEGSTLFKSEDIETAAAQMMTFKNVQGATLTEGIKLAADLASVYGMNLSETIRNVGRALDSPIQATRLLREYGIQLTKAQQDQLKVWDATGEKMKEQAMLLDILSGKVAGAAEAMDHGLKGATHDLDTAWKNLMVNEGLELSKSIDGIREWATEHENAVKAVMASAAAWAPMTAVFAQHLDEQTQSPEQKSFYRLQSAQQDFYSNLAPRMRKMGALPGDVANPETALTYATNNDRGSGPMHDMIDALTTVVNLREQAAGAIQKEAMLQHNATLAAQEQVRLSKQEAADAVRAAAEKKAAAAAERMLQSDTDKVGGLRDETAEMRMTNAEIARYEILKNSGNMALADEAFRLTTVIDQYHAEQKALDEAARKQEELNRKKEEATQRVEDYIARLNEESTALQLGDKASPGGHDAAVKEASSPGERAAIAAAEQRLTFYKLLAAARSRDEKEEDASAKRVEALWEHSLKRIVDDFASLFDKVLSGKEHSFKQFCSDILAAWSKTLSQMGAEMLTSQLFGGQSSPGGGSGGTGAAGGILSGIIGGLLSGGDGSNLPFGQMMQTATDASAEGAASVDASIAAGVFHAGGVAGRESNGFRSMPAGLFASAPRYHGGLAGDEMPAVLRRGESVLTPEQMREVSSGGDTHVHLHLSAVDGRSAEQFLTANQGHIARIVGDAVTKNRTFANHVRGR